MRHDPALPLSASQAVSLATPKQCSFLKYLAIRLHAWALAYSNICSCFAGRCGIVCKCLASCVCRIMTSLFAKAWWMSTCLVNVTPSLCTGQVETVRLSSGMLAWAYMLELEAQSWHNRPGLLSCITVQAKAA